MKNQSLNLITFSTENDRKEWVEAIRVSREILKSPSIQKYSNGEISPGPNGNTDQRNSGLDSKRC